MTLTQDQISALRKNGGGTFAVWHSPLSMILPLNTLVDAMPYLDSAFYRDGYLVALDALVEPIPDRYLGEYPFRDQLYAGLDKVQDRLVGFWLNEGHWHVDLVVFVHHLDQAVELAQTHNQKAIYRIATKKEVFIL